jgi:hypothetical protein
VRSLRKIAALFGVLFVTFTPLLFSSPAQADVQVGLTQDVYRYDPSSTPERQAYTLCSTGIVSDINWDVGGGVVAGCQEDFVLIHWYGYITLPVDGDVVFQSYADDGFYMTIGENVVIDNWWLKGCWGTQGTAKFEAGVSQKIDIWWYEYGGGACNYLYYNDPTTGLTLTNPNMFTTEPVVPVIPPSLNAPINIQTSVVETNVTVTWDTPQDTGTAIERYALFWTYDDLAGWAVAVTENTFTLTGLPENKEIKIWLRSDNDTIPVYSPNTEIVLVTTGTIYVPPPPPPPVDPPVDPPVEPPVDPEPVDPEPVKPEPPVIEPPVVEPPIVEPPVATPEEKLEELTDIVPSELTEEQVEQLQEAAYEVLETAEEGSPEYEEALDALFIAAQADDIEVPEELAAVPVLGNLAVGLTDAVNFVGNVGADMSPKTREAAEKQVIVSVVAVGAAVQAAAGAATSAAAAASSSSPSRRK